VSLTGELKRRDSALRAFFEERPGHTTALVEEFNRTLRAGQERPPLNGGGDPQLVGTAADIVLGAWLDPTSIPAPMAASPTLDGVEVMIAARQQVREALPGRELPNDARIAALTPPALALARFVAVARSRQAHRWLAERLPAVATTPAECTGRLWNDADERDLRALLRAVTEDHAALSAADDVHAAPTFALSRALGGADADLIADRTLWDYKSTASARIARREDIWQLAGYLLADTHDRYRLRAVGISALRWRTRHRRPAREFIAQLSGRSESTVDLVAWRAALAEILRHTGADRLEMGRRTPR
jgi:hypothetical protein